MRIFQGDNSYLYFDVTQATIHFNFDARLKLRDNRLSFIIFLQAFVFYREQNQEICILSISKKKIAIFGFK